MSIPKQMLQRLPIALTKVKTETHLKICLLKSDQSFALCREQKKLLKKRITIL